MRRETGSPKKWIIPELRVLALTKRHVGSGNEIGEFLARLLIKHRARMTGCCIFGQLVLTENLKSNRPKSENLSHKEKKEKSPSRSN